jgi:protein O-mannosyl-transferase
LFAVAALLPVLGLVPFDFQAVSTVADHYLYTAMVGVALAIASCLALLPPRWWLVPAAVVVVALGVQSVLQTRIWQNDLVFGQYWIRQNPLSCDAHNQVASSLFASGKVDESLPYARRAVEVAPDNVPARMTLASVLVAKGLRDEAEQHLRRAVDIEPKSSSAPLSLALLLGEQGRLDEALPLARRAVQLRPDRADARAALGNILAQQERFDEAAEHLTFAAARSRDPQLHTNLAFVLARLGRVDEARRHLQTALQINPDFAPARTSMAQLEGSGP